MFAAPRTQRQIAIVESDAESQVDWGETSVGVAALRPGSRARGWLLASILAGALALAGVVLTMRGVPSQTQADTNSDVGLSWFGTYASNAASGLDAVSGMFKDVEQIGEDTDGLMSDLNVTKEKIVALESAAEKKIVGTHNASINDKRFLSNSTPLHQNYSLHDGNVCADDEELHTDLCYKKCSLLTGGEYPIRTTPWSCCHARPCGLFNQIFKKFSICSGFDVSGDSTGNVCPHSQGVCLDDEELYLGLCYKRCSFLTQGEYMWRSAISTCCKVHNEVNCMLPWYAKTSPQFHVGGGMANGVHRPLTALTEQV